MAYIYEELNTGEVTRRLYADKENNGFTYEGCQALAEWLEQYTEDCGENMELDVVALRCDYNEYANLEEFNVDYFGKGREDEFYADIDGLREDTTVIEVGNTGRIIVGSF